VTDLRADCANCFALCCVALPFTRSADFAIDKPAGTPCRHLRADFACGVHDRLRSLGFPGCHAYDCFGAGQRVAQQSFGGRDWRSHPELAAPMFGAFATMRHLHELLWYLTEALGWPAARAMHPDLRSALDATEHAAAAEANTLAALDVNAVRDRVAPLLRRASALVRGPGAPDRSGADLAGADLRRTPLRAADLRNTRLIGADLRGTALERADLLGADLRGADLRGADLSTALYVTQAQVNAARGDAATRLPTRLDRPTHWPTAPL
jgi:hypothetical protein